MKPTQAQLQSMIARNARIITVMNEQYRKLKQEAKELYHACDKDDPETYEDFMALNSLRSSLRYAKADMKHFDNMQKLLKTQLKEITSETRMISPSATMPCSNCSIRPGWALPCWWGY